MRLIRCATLTVASLESAKAYCRDMDYVVAETGTISNALARSWDAEKLSGAPYVILKPASGANVYIRMIEQPAPKNYKPLTTYGWAAIEICTQDTPAVNKRMENTNAFEIIGPPKQLDGVPAIFPMQVKGADNEVVYLTQIKSDLPDYDLPRAQSLIDKLFILVVASPDLDAESNWLESHLKISKGSTMEINYTMINGAFGLPDGTQHKLVTFQHGRDVFLEVDQYPKAATARTVAPGYLPPCIALGSFQHPEFETLSSVNADHWITPPQIHDGIVYNGKAAASLRSPGGTLFELIEV